MKKVNLNLPEWAFLDAYSHEGNLLLGRDVFIHVRSCTVMEVFDSDMVSLNPDAIHLNFKYNNILNVLERKTLVVHYTFAEDDIIEIMRAAAKWYCEYMDWTDIAMSEEDISSRN